MTNSLARLLRYDVWANRQTLESLPEGNTPPRSLRWMNHIVGAELLWLSRMANKPAPLPVWPDLSLGECAKHLERLSSELLESLNHEPLSQPVSYTNSKGEPWTSTVEEILTHLVIHSAYHRGQIASDLRTAGHEPVYTDYIHAVRQRLVE
ncbi:MAG TPA: DinB family protein [Gemmatimonadales bacterium]|nr:DinB family protein [Gemmatimonadales bacterium]